MGVAVADPTNRLPLRGVQGPHAFEMAPEIADEIRADGVRGIAAAPIGASKRRLTIGMPQSDLLLMAAWSAIGIATATNYGNYSASSVVLVTLGVFLLTVTITRRLVPNGARNSAMNGRWLGVGTAILAAVALPAGVYGSGADLYSSRLLTAAAALIVATWLILRLPKARGAAYVVVAIMTVAGIAMLLASPKPVIDVWYMLQAAGHGLSHGHNIYTLKWTGDIPGEVSNRFVYLPGSAVLLWPFHILFGDVRYGLLAAMAITGVLLIRVSKKSESALLACLFLLYPRFLFGLEQSWVDPLSLLALCLTGYCVMRGRKGWAVVAFAVALSCKQYNWLIIPFAAMWSDFGWRRTTLSVGGASLFVLPWAVADVHAFVSGSFSYLFDSTPRLDSLSLYTTILRHGIDPGSSLTVVGIGSVIALSMWRLPRDTYGFFVGSAAVIAVYDLFNKLSYYNAWSFAGGLALFAVVFGRASQVALEEGAESLDLVEERTS